MINQLSADEKYLRLKTLVKPQGTPNVFEILGVQNSEIRNSNIIAWLLSVNGSHGLKDFFLINLLKLISADDSSIELIKNNFDNIKTHREYHLSGGYLDVFIEVGNELNIVIENKIADYDSVDQLRFYQNEISQKHQSRRNVFIYLTPSGVKTQIQGYHSISYADLNAIIQTGIDQARDQLAGSILKMYADFIQLHYAQKNIRQLCLELQNEFDQEIANIISGDQNTELYFYADLIRNYSSDLFISLFEHGKSFLKSFSEIKTLQSSMKSAINFLTKSVNNFQLNRFNYNYLLYTFGLKGNGLFITGYVYASIKKNKAAKEQFNNLVTNSEYFSIIEKGSYVFVVFEWELMNFLETPGQTIDQLNNQLTAKIGEFIKQVLPFLDYEFLRAFND